MFMVGQHELEFLSKEEYFAWPRRSPLQTVIVFFIVYPIETLVSTIHFSQIEWIESSVSGAEQYNNTEYIYIYIYDSPCCMNFDDTSFLRFIWKIQNRNPYHCLSAGKKKNLSKKKRLKSNAYCKINKWSKYSFLKIQWGLRDMRTDFHSPTIIKKNILYFIFSNIATQIHRVCRRIRCHTTLQSAKRFIKIDFWWRQ